MTTVSAPTDSHPTTMHEAPATFTVPHEKSMLAAFSPSLIVADLDLDNRHFPRFSSTNNDQQLSSTMSSDRLVDRMMEKGSSGSDEPPRTPQSNGLSYRRADVEVRRAPSDDPLTQDTPPTHQSFRSPQKQASGDNPSVVGNYFTSPVDSPVEQEGKHEGLPYNTASTQQQVVFTHSPESMKDVITTLQEDARSLQTPVPIDQSMLDSRQQERERASAYSPSNPRHPSAPSAGLVADRNSVRYPNPIIPSSASPSYKPGPSSNIPFSSNNRALAQQPTYITPPAAPNPVNPVYSPGPPRVQEEICVECAMRDQDMADVDVTGPGVWDRDSDVHYRDLLQRELEEETSLNRSGTSHRHPSDPNKPRARGGKLTEHNLKVWMTMNPRDPQSRHQAIELYVKTQTSLLEAEALARARAMQESRALENRMRDAYEHVRRSTHDLNGNAANGDETGVRLRTPRSAPGRTGSFGADVRHSRQHSRDVTLLENGLLVEHVDVRKEEKEERERRRKEERRERSRARKSSRSSAVDVRSMYSAHSPIPHADSGFHTAHSTGDASGQRPMSRYSQSSSRPMSVSTMPLTPQTTRPANGRLHSQISLADTQSISSASVNRGSRFFTFRNWSTAWRSQESFAPSGMSGSMMDMHLALDNESHPVVPSPLDMVSSSPSMLHADQWPRRSVSTEMPGSLNRPKKKGLAKIWKIFTGGKGSSGDANSNRSRDAPSQGTEDDLPLAPPPPLSYLVNRKAGDRVPPSPRHASNPRPTSVSPNRTSIASPPNISPPTAGSSVVPTPTSAYHQWQEPQIAGEGRKGYDNDFDPNTLPSLEEDVRSNGSGKELPRFVHPVVSAPDIRQRMHESFSAPSFPPAAQNGLDRGTQRPMSVMSLQKSLPPLPDEPSAPADMRPQTMYSYDTQAQLYHSSTPQNLLTPQAAFRGPDGRRQSFGGSTSRPSVPALHTFPISAKQYDTASPAGQRSPALQYTEFGSSRYSLGRLEDMRHYPPEDKRPSTPSKRRSKFGLAYLLGRKTPIQEPRRSLERHEFSDSRMSEFGIRHEVMVNTYGGLGGGKQPASRMSVASRKAIEELVDQDPNFVAYRYPSVEQSIDILR